MDDAEVVALKQQLAEQRAALQRAQHELGHLRGLLDQHAIVSEADIHGSITYVNEQFCAISGYSREELIGQNHRIIKSGIHPREFYEEIWTTIASGKAWQGVVCNRRKDGCHYWVRGTIIPLLGADGLPERYISIRTDITAIKEAELSLRLMAHALEASTVGIVIADATHGEVPFVYYNPAFAAMTGSEVQPFLSSESRIRRGHKKKIAHVQDLRAALRSGSSQLLRRHGPQGKEQWLELSVASVHDAEGRLSHYIGIANDVTGRQQAAQALHSSEERLRRAQAYANIGTWDWDLVSGELFWSERIGPMFGYDGMVETTYENFINAVHPDDRQVVIDAVNACVERGEKYEIEHRCVWPDGSVRWMLEQGDVSRDADGKPLHMLGVVQDITPRKLAEEKLKAAKLSLANAQRIAKLGNWDADLLSGELHWSDEIYRIFGRNPATFTPSVDNFYATIHPDDMSMFKMSEEQSFRTGVHDVVHRIVLPNGMVRHVHEQGEVYFDADGQPVSMSGTVQDVTERVERERQLHEAKEEAERANHAKSMFLSSMSHELRTPMNAILGFAQLLQMQGEMSADQAENVGEILRAGRHLLDLINEVLDLSKIEVGRLHLVLESARCCDLVDECISLTRALAEQHGIRISECERSLCPVWFQADRRRLKQVILNLITNAIKYNRPDGSVKVRIARGADAGRVRIEVEDTGMGIPADKRHELFEPFERLDADEKGIEGTGIGLAISKRLIEAMGGSIGLESTLGAGSTFWVELPETAAADAIEEQAVAVHAHESAEAMAKLLYIEDNPANLRVMEKIIAARPTWCLLAAHLPQLGLDLARAHVPDLILLDIKMPGMDGYEVMRQLQEDAATAHIPVIAVSANAMESDQALGEAAGFLHYLPKPVEVPRLLAVLDSLLR